MTGTAFFVTVDPSGRWRKIWSVEAPETSSGERSDCWTSWTINAVPTSATWANCVITMNATPLNDGSTKSSSATRSTKFFASRTKSCGKRG